MPEFTDVSFPGIDFAMTVTAVRRSDASQRYARQNETAQMQALKPQRRSRSLTRDERNHAVRRRDSLKPYAKSPWALKKQQDVLSSSIAKPIADGVEASNTRSEANTDIHGKVMGIIEGATSATQNRVFALAAGRAEELMSVPNGEIVAEKPLQLSHEDRPLDEKDFEPFDETEFSEGADETRTLSPTDQPICKASVDETCLMQDHITKRAQHSPQPAMPPRGNLSTTTLSTTADIRRGISMIDIYRPELFDPAQMTPRTKLLQRQSIAAMHEKVRQYQKRVHRALEKEKKRLAEAETKKRNGRAREEELSKQKG